VTIGVGVIHPIGWHRAKDAMRKGKAKEGSSSQSEIFLHGGWHDVHSEEVNTSFAKAQLWRQWNKLKDCSTMNMDEEELQIHRYTLQIIQRDLQFAQANEETIDDEDDK
jgi:hypothetical protein